MTRDMPEQLDDMIKIAAGLTNRIKKLEIELQNSQRDSFEWKKAHDRLAEAGGNLR